MHSHVNVDGIILDINDLGIYPIHRFYRGLANLENGEMISDMIALSQNLLAAFNFKHVPELSANPYYDQQLLDIVTEILTKHNMLHLLDKMDYKEGVVVNDKFYEYSITTS